MTGQYHTQSLKTLGMATLLILSGTQADAARTAKSVDMTGEWEINGELTSEARDALPEPRKRSGFLSGLMKRMHVSVGIPGTPASVPVPGTGSDSNPDDASSEPLHSYGTVAEIKIRQRPDQFAIDYGMKRVSLYDPDETTVEKIDKRKVTTTSGWRGDRYIIRTSADDGSKMSEEFELISDGRQLKWTVVDHPKGRPEITEVAIYDRIDAVAGNGREETPQP